MDGSIDRNIIIQIIIKVFRYVSLCYVILLFRKLLRLALYDSHFLVVVVVVIYKTIFNLQIHKYSSIFAKIALFSRTKLHYLQSLHCIAKEVMLRE